MGIVKRGISPFRQLRQLCVLCVNCVHCVCYVLSCVLSCVRWVETPLKAGRLFSRASEMTEKKHTQCQTSTNHNTEQAIYRVTCRLFLNPHTNKGVIHNSGKAIIHRTDCLSAAGVMSCDMLCFSQKQAPNFRIYASSSQ